MKRFVLSFAVTILIVGMLPAQTVPFAIQTDVGYLFSHATSIYLDNDSPSYTGDTDDDNISGSGGARVGLDAFINLGRARRFGFGFSYRWINPDAKYTYNGFGANIGVTGTAFGGSLITRLSVAGGPARIQFEEDVLDLVNLEFGSRAGAFGEVEFQAAMPVFPITRFSERRSLFLAPYLSLYGGGVAGKNRVQSETLVSIEDGTWRLGATTWYSGVSVGASVVLIDSHK